jgi:cyclopropane fatty-acyl-phospholipid synthase-like methyltransferase
LDYIRDRFDNPGNVSYVTTNGHDFPGVAHDTVDFVFSFGTFVHLEQPVIARYIESLAPLLQAGAHVVLQISNSQKADAMAQKPSFAANSPEFMVDTFARNGIAMLEVDNEVLFHSTMLLGKKT